MDKTSTTPVPTAWERQATTRPEQRPEIPAELAPLSLGLTNLKLSYWRDALERDWPTLKPADQKWLASSMKSWIEMELSQRHSASIQRRIEGAKFIRNQTVDQFNFGYNDSTRAIEKDYLKLHQRTLDGNIPRAVFVGNTGLGKTHLGRALGYVACQAGLSVLFTRASQIVNELATAKAVHNLERELRKYRKPQLLIVDELGYVMMDTEAGNLFFQVISDRHDRGLGTIVTTNFAFGHWNQIFAAESTALVIVERLTADAEVFYLEGESYPQSQKRKKTSKQKQ
jgi:DNA replication protein DnaC